MIELVFTACLASSPAVCEERSLTFIDVSPMTCMMGAQPQLAKWVESHPKWKVSGWKCRMGGADEREA